MIKYTLLLVTSFVLFVSCKDSSDKPERKVKNIILMIGDGMGTAQIYAAYTANKAILNIEKAAYVGFAKTSSSNKYITDSGAAGTAISTGHKTYNNAIGVDKNGRKVVTISESAKENGLSTGILVTCQLTHATPASFVSHQAHRKFYEAIARDYVYSGTDLFIGGGQRYFNNRDDSLNYVDSLKYYGYSVVYNIDSISITSRIKTACFVGWDNLLKVSEGRGSYLPKATKIALEKLNLNPSGFFILIEGSQIDWGGHKNDIQYVVEETIDFDNAVGEAFKFADTHPGTLVIVASDHETGGLALVGGDLETGELEAIFSSDYHTAEMVPVFTYGTGAEVFAGIYENTEIYHKMMNLLGFNE